tara:strand:- start:133 stop:330 length:198 start_codon:yes stop_codon:yes gene_type:complete
MTRTEEIVQAKLNLNHWLAVRNNNNYDPVLKGSIPKESMNAMIEHLQEKVDMLESVEELINTTLN